MEQIEQTEIWKDIVGYEGLYQVSSLGRFKSFHKKKTRENGGFLNPYKQSKGYQFIDLRKEGKMSRCLAHRIVAITFIPNPDSLPQVNHKDSDKTNIKADNLEWVTNLQNLYHAINNGRPPGRKRKIAIIKENI